MSHYKDPYCIHQSGFHGSCHKVFVLPLLTCLETTKYGPNIIVFGFLDSKSHVAFQYFRAAGICGAKICNELVDLLWYLEDHPRTCKC